MSCRMRRFFSWRAQSSHMFCSFSLVSCAYIKEREKETALNFITFTDIETLFDLFSYFALNCISSVINQRIYVRYGISLCRYISAFAVMQVYLIRVDGSSQILHPFVSLCSWTTRKALTTCGGAHLEKKKGDNCQLTAGISRLSACLHQKQTCAMF